jgi:hypothetical protein
MTGAEPGGLTAAGLIRSDSERIAAKLAVDNMWITCAKTAPNLCAHWGNVGDAIAGPSRNIGLTWHNAPRALCIDKELKIVHTLPCGTGK